MWRKKRAMARLLRTASVKPRTKWCWSGMMLEVAWSLRAWKGELCPCICGAKSGFQTDCLTRLEPEDCIVPQSNFTCLMCETDITMDENAKKRKWSRHDLNRHLQSSTHTREAQLRRALKMDGKTENSTIVCPQCGMPYKGFQKFFDHLREDTENHQDVLWERIEESSDDEEEISETGEVPRQRFSVESPPKSSSSPLPRRVDRGKGKAKA
jgi:hypothetical protein